MSRGQARAPRPWVERVRARHARRQARFDRELARVRRGRPADQVGVAVDYLRGALVHAPEPAVGREVDLLLRTVKEAVARLHEAELRAQP
ncbi:hypothetical protein [Frankia sp. ACN1ag]|uniref:hypothetical protein n=1 Tax=Frankia sp. ACN1ag TaxID=102891 RepID=UPI0006DCD378|nr:hypothetical protein [Frankia sp. ACN1ag]KQC35048.1 hypothetical protein UK82_28740 [Frankia sp. ACN1ag]